MVNWLWISSRNKVHPEFYLTTQTNVKLENSEEFVGLVNFKTSDVITNSHFRYRSISHTFFILKIHSQKQNCIGNKYANIHEK